MEFIEGDVEIMEGHPSTRFRECCSSIHKVSWLFFSSNTFLPRRSCDEEKPREAQSWVVKLDAHLPPGVPRLP